MAKELAHTVQCLKDAGLRSVWLIERPGEPRRTIKSWPLTPWFAIKLLLRIAQPQRQARGARLLQQAGLSTPRIHTRRLALIGHWPVVQLELDFIEGCSALELVLEGQVAKGPGRAVANQIGNLVTALSAADLRHRDLKLSNIIVQRSNDDWRLTVIDTVGVKQSTNRAESLAVMLDRLAVQLPAHGIMIPRWMAPAVLHPALRPLDRLTRRAVLQQLRARRPR